MNKGTEELIASMKAAAEKATCGKWSLAYREDGFDADDGLIMREVVGFLPIAKIEGASPDSGFDEAFQKEQQANAEFIHAAQPENTLKLIAALELKEEQRANWFQIAQRLGEEMDAAEKRIAELELQRGLAFMAYNHWRDNCTEAESRIAELEASKLSVKLPSEFIEMYGTKFYMHAHVVEAIRAAGGSVEGSD